MRTELFDTARENWTLMFPMRIGLFDITSENWAFNVANEKWAFEILSSISILGL